MRFVGCLVLGLSQICPEDLAHPAMRMLNGPGVTVEVPELEFFDAIDAF
jgi:hypothetical protein